MRFFSGSSAPIGPPEAYERLLADAVSGDRTLFLGEDEIERAWEIVQPVLAPAQPPTPYPAGTWGPSAEHLISPHLWHLR